MSHPPPKKGKRGDRRHYFKKIEGYQNKIKYKMIHDHILDSEVFGDP